MKKAEMQDLVDKIAIERANHLNTIEKLSLADIKSIQRKSYVPRRRTKDELIVQAKSFVKPSFKGSGNGGELFSLAPIMKPKLLDPWTLSRVQAPEKASTKFFFTGQDPFTYTGNKSREFPAPDDQTLSIRQREILTDQRKKYKDWVSRPSKYRADPKQPLCFERETKYMKTDKNNRTFGFNTHTSWENF